MYGAPIALIAILHNYRLAQALVLSTQVFFALFEIWEFCHRYPHFGRDPMLATVIRFLFAQILIYIACIGLIARGLLFLTQKARTKP
jgi:hypothetical protein